MQLRIGIDSYSYHRLLGEIRPGEAPPRRRFDRGFVDVVEHARALGVDGVSLETCFLDPPGRLDAAALLDTAGPLELVLAWGHPDGLELGASDRALADLLEWIAVAERLGCGLVRCVAASPRFRADGLDPGWLERTADRLRSAAKAARMARVTLAVENHGDLTAAELLELLDRTGDELVGVCFDTANALRVGDDPLEAARLLAERTLLVHLKDTDPGSAGELRGPRSVAYGEGAVPLGEVLDTLRGVGFDGLVCVELGQLGADVGELELVERCVDWLRSYESSNG